MLDFSVPDFLIAFMEGSGFKAFISFGMFMLDSFSKLYDVLFITKLSDVMIGTLTEIIVFLPDDFEAIVNNFLTFIQDNIADWTLFGLPVAFVVMGGGLVIAVVLSILKLIWGFVKSIFDIAI